MNEKEIAEIRRRFRPDKSNITHIRGCYVNEKREIVSAFNQPLALLPEEEAEKMLATLKRTLSGALGKNLIDITFATGQVVDSQEHRLLMALRDSSLNDEQAVGAFQEKIIQSLNLEGNYLILLACDKYDVPYRSRDGETQDDAASEVYSYILCSICPVKQLKSALSYRVRENAFCSYAADGIVAAPELGFLFPAFDDRCANIYNALYYSRDTAENHQELVDAVFNTEIPMPAAAQKETFQSVLGEALAEDCKLEVVEAVHETLRGIMEEHKANKEEEPLVLSKGALKTVLASCGVSQENVEAFDEKFDTAFGAEADLRPQNIVDTKHFQVCTPDVVIHVNPARGELLETRTIDGVKYILIRADQDVEVNGVNIHI